MQQKQQVSMQTKLMSLFLLVLMVLSVAGFALMSAGPSAGQTGDNGLPDEVPLQQITEGGQTLWFAVKNSELFIFESIDTFIGDFESESLATQITPHRQLFIYVDPSFGSSDAEFLIQKALTGLRIDHQRVFSPQCTPNTLVFTSEEVFEGECIVFSANDSQAFSKAESVVYHLVK